MSCAGRRGKLAHEEELALHLRVILVVFVPVSAAEAGHVLRALLVSWCV